MTALTKARANSIKKAGGMDFPVAANAVIYPGARVVLKDGYLEPATAAASLTPVGTADDRNLHTVFDNTGGNDGDITCYVDFGKEKTFAKMIGKDGEFTQADMGGPAYLEDDQTVTTTSTTRTALGNAYKIETKNSIQSVWVEI